MWDEKQCATDSLPEFPLFLEFLEQRFRTLESLEATRNNTNIFIKKPVSKKVTTFQSTNAPSKTSSQVKESNASRKFSCKFCSKTNHSIRKCFKFKKLKPQERVNFANSVNICTNCLSVSHKIQDCETTGRCEFCNEKHNSLLCLSP